MALALFLLPLAGALIALLVPSSRLRPKLVPVCAALHLALVVSALRTVEVTAFNGWIVLDKLGRIALPLVSVVFFACSLYVPGYLRLRPERPNRIFCGALLAFLAMMTLITESYHLGLMWVALEANTLASAPLIYFNRNQRSLEATWKYLLLGAVGIALALLGSFFLAYAALHAGRASSLLFEHLLQEAPMLSRPWLHTAFVVLLVGYGTKMGLAPMHTWKPDTYGEAPGIVGAMLAGGVTTVAFTAVLRVRAVVAAAGAGATADRTLLAIGLFSMLIAALFLLGTRDFKRMLAYSSVEHMGILAFGAALGAAGAFAAIFHVWANSLTKGSLFLSAGNLRRATGARTTDEVSGMALLTPRSAAMFVAGMFAVTALPPFGPFFSELRVVRAAFEANRLGAAAVFLGCLLFAFFGLTRLVFAIVDGRPRAASRETAKRFPETLSVILPPFVLLLLSLWLGLATPAFLTQACHDAVTQLYPAALP
jgi:hydrogenase-4 component F